MENQTAAQPRHRYREVAPEHISVPVGELLNRIPADYRRGDIPEGDGRVDLPCADLLQGNTPRLSLGILDRLLPGLVVVPEGGQGTPLDLPPGWIAGHYRLVTLREEIPSVDLSEPAAAPQKENEQNTGAEPRDFEESKGESAPVIPHEEKIDVSPEERESMTAASSGQESKGDVEAGLPPEEGNEGNEGMPDMADNASGPRIKDAEAKEEPADPPVRKPGFFASLPIFRRRQTREASEPSTTTPEVIVEAAALIVEPPAPKQPITEPKQPPSVPMPAPLAESALIATDAPEPAPVVSLEPLWKFDPQDQLADSSALQALFMTEDKLTLEGVVSKAGELPGLNACVLAHGDRVICASKTPAGVDLQTLSGHALTMLSQIRESSSKMGLGAVPAVTLHADQGVVSFLHKGELCLLVLHADRGFVPGVRERLQEMLGHLADARPALSERSPAAGH